MRLAASLSALRSDQERNRGDLTLPSSPIPNTFANNLGVRLALEADDRPVLLLPLSSGELRQDRPKAAGLEVSVVQFLLEGRKRATYFLQLKCAQPALENVFLDLVENVCTRIREGHACIASVAGAIAEFRHLLENTRGGVERTRIIGLMGELLVLNKLLQTTSYAVNYWTGPDGGRRDFLFPEAAVEVKATEKSTTSAVEIHSLAQLDTDDTDQLFIWFVRLEDDPGKGVTVSEVVADIEQRVTDLELFRARLVAQSYHRDTADHWDVVRFSLIESQPFRVGPGFPRIVPDSLHEGVPPGVTGVRYQVDLAHAREHTLSIQGVLKALGV